MQLRNPIFFILLARRDSKRSVHSNYSPIIVFQFNCEQVVLPLATKRAAPSGENASPRTGVSRCHVFTGSNDSPSQARSVRSSPPVTSQRPLGLNATAR